MLRVKELFQKMKQPRAGKIIRYYTVRFIGFAWSKTASVVVCVSDFEFTSICPFKGSRVPEYLFSISDTSENNKENTTSKYASDLCDLCFRKQISKFVTDLS